MGDVAYRQDALRKLRFVHYIRDCHRSWLSFAKSSCERAITLSDLILVTGCDKTSDWACAAFSEKSKSAGIDFMTGPGIVDGGLSIWGRWSTAHSVDSNVGPRNPIPPSANLPSIESIPPALGSEELSLTRSPSNTMSPSSISSAPPSTSNQCVFLRGYRMCDYATFVWRKLHKVQDGFTYFSAPFHLKRARDHPPSDADDPPDPDPPGDAAPGPSSGGGASGSASGQSAGPSTWSQQPGSSFLSPSGSESSSAQQDAPDSKIREDIAAKELLELDEETELCLQLSLEKVLLFFDTLCLTLSVNMDRIQPL